VKVCGSQGSLLSLLTIEYDVHEDLPEKTGVFELEPSSGELVRLLLKRRFPHLSDVDIDTIQRASDGNARVAIALAETVEVGQSVATLKDADVFRRLFEQRQAPNPSVLQSAQAAALVYSFDGVDDSDSEQAEMWKLARTQGLQLQNFHQDLKELERRDLLQKRGPWRALLPHAIANRLAAMALENILPKDLKLFCDSASPRLFQSLSRRLGFLHESEPAKELVKAWLAQGGRLGTVANTAHWRPGSHPRIRASEVCAHRPSRADRGLKAWPPSQRISPSARSFERSCPIRAWLASSGSR
jgi:hypothetical protein